MPGFPHLCNNSHAARRHKQKLGNLQSSDLMLPWGRHLQDLKASFVAETADSISEISQNFTLMAHFLLLVALWSTFKAKNAYITMCTNVFKRMPHTHREGQQCSRRSSAMSGLRIGDSSDIQATTTSSPAANQSHSQA